MLGIYVKFIDRLWIITFYKYVLWINEKFIDRLWIITVYKYVLWIDEKFIDRLWIITVYKYVLGINEKFIDSSWINSHFIKMFIILWNLITFECFSKVKNDFWFVKLGEVIIKIMYAYQRILLDLKLYQV